MIPQEWRKKQGEGSIVGIVDTGINCFLDCFKNVKMTYKTFGNTDNRHGTHIASTVLQFAPKSQIVFGGGVFENYSKLEDMLEWISEYRLDVLNLSLSYSERNEKIENLLSKIHSNGTIIVAAFNSKMTYPCKYPFILKAGNNGEFNAPEEWLSYFHDGRKGIMKGSSVSSAITSGLCSLAKAITPSMNKEDFLATVSLQDVFFSQGTKKQVNVKL